MRRLALAALCALACAPPAAAATIGIGAFGGGQFPIVQEDAGSGAAFGVRVPITVLPMLSVEPYWRTASLGEVDFEADGVTYTRDGFDHTALGVHVALGSLAASTRFGIYPYAGIAAHKLEREGSADIEETGFDFGLGIGFTPATRIRFDVRGELNMIVTGDTSRKFGTASLGVSYDVWSK